MQNARQNHSQAILSRRQLLQAGMAVSVAALFDSCGPVRNETLAEHDPLLFALNVGLTAPNPHNTQAWKIRKISDLEAELYVDESKLLPATDPPARQIHIGQGTFIEHFCLGAAHRGHAVDVRLFPQGEYFPDQIGKRPVARLSMRPAKVAADALFDQIVQRTTNRTEYGGADITDAEFQRMKSSLSSFAGRLEMHSGNGGRFCELFQKAFEVETDTLATNEESRQWFRFNDAEIESSGDGISLRGNGMSGLKYYIASHFVMENSEAYWNAPDTKRYSIEAFQAQAISAKGLVFLITPQNGLIDQVQAGRAYARLQLSATMIGLASHPMSQILQEYAEMTALRKEFEKLVGIKGSEKVQMILRLGRSDYFFRAPRRPLASFLV